jgi:hypothetical protein
MEHVLCEHRSVWLGFIQVTCSVVLSLKLSRFENALLHFGIWLSSETIRKLSQQHLYLLFKFRRFEYYLNYDGLYVILAQVRQPIYCIQRSGREVPFWLRVFDQALTSDLTTTVLRTKF